MEIRNPIYTSSGLIDVEINHPKLGWVPFTASPSDPEAHGRVIYDAALAMAPAAYKAPPLPDPATVLYANRAKQSLSRRQTFIGMHRMGLITAQEAVAGAKDGTVPAALEPIFAAMPDPDQTDARITFATFTRAERLDPMTLILQATGKVSDAEMDIFFDKFAGV